MNFYQILNSISHPVKHEIENNFLKLTLHLKDSQILTV